MSVVKKIILINLSVFGICSIFSIWGLHLENIFALYSVNSEYFSFYQIITHLFIHANPEHLFFNMLFLLITGPEVENYFGDKFLKFYLLSGILSSGLYCLGVNSGIIGASGAVFSVVTVSLFRTFKDENFKLYWSLKFKFLFFLFMVLSEFYYVINSSDDNIGHWAHVFGVIFGASYYLYNKFAQPEV